MLRMRMYPASTTKSGIKLETTDVRRVSYSSRVSPATALTTTAGTPALSARSRAFTLCLLLTTATTSAARIPDSQASRIAWRFEPFPETNTTNLIGALMATTSLVVRPLPVELVRRSPKSLHQTWLGLTAHLLAQQSQSFRYPY